MLTKKKAMAITSQCENLVYFKLSDLSFVLQLHAELGMSEMEVWIIKKKSNRLVEAFRKKGFYCRVIEFKSLKDECKLYISWISDL